MSSSSSSTPLVSYTVNEDTKVGTITLESPDTLNALTLEVASEFEDLLFTLEKDLNRDSNVQAIVLCGAGTKAFSAGGNMEWLTSFGEAPVHANVDAMLHFYQSFLRMRQKLPVPVIGAIQGPAMGAGAGLALACDMRVGASSQKALLGFPFTQLGMPSGMGGLYQLQQAGLSSCQAMEILLLGKTLTGEEAMELGLLNRLVPKDQVKDEAHSLAATIARRHPVAIRSLVRSWRLGKDVGLSEALYRDAHAQAMCYNRDDWGRGLEAVMAKTEANFDPYHSS